MEYRQLGSTGWKISAISLGTWAMGSAWGAVDKRESLAALNRALDLGVNFFDTADAYGSEPLLGELRRQRHEPFHIATKMVDFQRTIAITLGLPFIRTSVDHGTAFDLAGKGTANPLSMVEAIQLAAVYAPGYRRNRKLRSRIDSSI